MAATSAQVLHEGYDAICTLLLRKGAKMDATDDGGVTPLMLAAAGGHAAVVALLVKEGADVLLADKKKKTALFCAAGGSFYFRHILLDASPLSPAAATVNGFKLS